MQWKTLKASPDRKSRGDKYPATGRNLCLKRIQGVFYEVSSSRVFLDINKSFPKFS